ELVNKYKAPDKMLMIVTLPASNVVIQKQLVIGDSVSMMGMGTAQSLDAKEKKRAKESGKPFPELNYSKTDITISLAPMIALVDGIKAYVVELSSGESEKTREYF